MAQGSSCQTLNNNTYNLRPDPPLISSNLKADRVASLEHDVPFDVVLRVGQEEALAAVLVGDAAGAVSGALALHLGGHRAGHARLAEHLSVPPNTTSRGAR